MDRTYLPVLLLLGFVVANAMLILGLSHLTLRPRPTAGEADTPYESGMPPLGDARERFSVKFYMVAMLFIIFDIETVFMIPWGAYFRQLSCAVPLVSGACPAGQRVVLRPRRDARVHRASCSSGSSTSGRRERCNGTDARALSTESSTSSRSSQESWVTTRLDFLVNWGRANSLWPMPFGTACCAIEFMATAASKFDLARFGMERMSFSPRQADVLICAGRVPFKLAPVIRRIWQQMPQPKWCISMGACASTGGMFDNYAVVQGIDTIIPVDVYVPGLSAASRGAHVRHHDAAGEGQAASAWRTSRSATRWSPIRRASSTSRRRLIDELSEPFGNSVHQTRSGL